MKIIDFEKKGNLVRFWLGDDDCVNYYGDDWDDAPYEHNAGTVYDEFVKGYVDVVFPFDSLVMEPRDDWKYQNNTPYCKDDMKDRVCPCIVVVDKAVQEKSWEDSYQYWAASQAKGTHRFFFGDKMEVPESKLIIMN